MPRNSGIAQIYFLATFSESAKISLTTTKRELKSEITRLYPNDKAIGFEVGDVRGALTVKIPLN